jgi:hypothetical protein
VCREKGGRLAVGGAERRAWWVLAFETISTSIHGSETGPAGKRIKRGSAETDHLTPCPLM